MAANAASTVVGATIGKHRIVRLVGGGEASRVFACRDNDLQSDRLVAVKVLRSRASAVADRLLQGSAPVIGVASPHVVQVFDVSVHKNMPTIVMELVEGESLAALLEKGPLSASDALELARSICLGLHAAWAQGVAHGDLRPNNVLLPEEDVRQAKVGDFLLAAPIPEHDGVRGTAAYLAPELLHGSAPDAQSDLYALGCLLFECVSGETPHAGTTAAILKAQAGKPAPSLGTRVPGPQGLIDLVGRMLEKDRGKRVKTHVEVLTAIARILRVGVVDAGRSVPARELGADMIDDLPVAQPAPAARLERHEPPRAPPQPAKVAVATPPKPPVPAPKTAPAPRVPSISLAELEVDPHAAEAFAAVHDEGVEMTRVADASMLLRGPPAARSRPPPRADVEDLEIDPNDAKVFEGVHDEGVEMTRVADVASLAAKAPQGKQPAVKQPAVHDMLTKMLDDGSGMGRAAPVKKSAADIRGAPVRAPPPPPTPVIDERDEKTRVVGGISPKATSAEEEGLLAEPLPPRKPKR